MPKSLFGPQELILVPPLLVLLLLLFCLVLNFEVSQKLLELTTQRRLGIVSNRLTHLLKYSFPKYD